MAILDTITEFLLPFKDTLYSSGKYGIYLALGGSLLAGGVVFTRKFLSYLESKKVDREAVEASALAAEAKALEGRINQLGETHDQKRKL